MSSLGPIQYEEPEGSVFLGRDYTKSKAMSDALSTEIDNEVRKIITSAQKEARAVLKKNRDLLELIKTLLLEKETIVAEEIEYIEKNMKLPPVETNENNEKQTTKVNIDDLVKNVEKKSKSTIKKTEIEEVKFEEKDETIESK